MAAHADSSTLHISLPEDFQHLSSSSPIPIPTPTTTPTSASNDDEHNNAMMASSHFKENIDSGVASQSSTPLTPPLTPPDNFLGSDHAYNKIWTGSFSMLPDAIPIKIEEFNRKLPALYTYCRKRLVKRHPAMATHVDRVEETVYEKFQEFRHVASIHGNVYATKNAVKDGSSYVKETLTHHFNENSKTFHQKLYSTRQTVSDTLMNSSFFKAPFQLINKMNVIKSFYWQMILEKCSDLYYSVQVTIFWLYRLMMHISTNYQSSMMLFAQNVNAKLPPSIQDKTITLGVWFLNFIQTWMSIWSSFYVGCISIVAQLKSGLSLALVKARDFFEFDKHVDHWNSPSSIIDHVNSIPTRVPSLLPQVKLYLTDAAKKLDTPMVREKLTTVVTIAHDKLPASISKQLEYVIELISSHLISSEPQDCLYEEKIHLADDLPEKHAKSE